MPSQRQSRSFRFVAAPVVVMALATPMMGCTLGQTTQQASLYEASKLGATRSMDGFPVSPANWPRQQWWEAFADSQLNELVREGLSDSPSLGVAAARVRQASALQSVEGSYLQPNVTGSFASTRERFSANGTTPAPVYGTWQTVNETRLSVGYELDFWGKNRAALDAAIGRTHAAEVDHYAAELMLSSAIVQAYIGLQEIDDDIDVYEHILKNQETVLGLSRLRYAAQLDSQVDMKQAEAAIPATRASIAALKEQLELGRNKLAALLGKGPDRGLSITQPQLKLPTAVALPSSLPAELLGHRPDVVAQRWRVEAATKEIKVAKAEFFPNVNLAAFVGLQSLGFELLDHSSSRILGFGPAISLPIFEGGRLRANLAVQNANYDLAVESYNQTLVDALHDIADQMSSIRWLKTRMEEQALAVKTAQDADYLAQQRYAAGLASYIQVLITQREVLNQRRLLVGLQARSLSLEANLSRALGGGYVPEPIPVPVALTSPHD